MPKKYFVTALVFILISLLSISCSQRIFDKDAETAFVELFPNVEWNKTLSLTVFREAGYGDKFGNFGDLTLENHSKETKVLFPLGFGAKILTYNSATSKWEEIENGMRYTSLGRTSSLLVPESFADWDKGEIPWGTVSVAPKIADRSQPIKIRVIVIGNLYVDNQKQAQLIGAYCDVELRP